MAEREQGARTAGAHSGADENIWVKCPGCREIAFRKEVERNLNVCPKCGYPSSADRRAALDDNRSIGAVGASFTTTSRPAIRWSSTIPSPIRSVSTQARRSAGRNDAVVTGVGKIEDHPVALAVMDFDFMGGSMGTVVGEKTRAAVRSRGQAGASGGGVLLVGRRADAGGRAVADADG